MAARPRVLISRPQSGTEPWCLALECGGFECLHLPMLSIEPVAVPIGGAVADILCDLLAFDLAVFISSNAANCMRDALQANGDAFPPQLRCIAVGASTAASLKAMGAVDVVQPQRETSEGLLALPQLQQLEAQRVLLVKGQGGRVKLAEEFIARGAKLQCCELYRRVRPDYGEGVVAQQLRQHPVDASIFLSAETLDNFFHSLGAEVAVERQLFTLPLIVPSERLAQYASQRGFLRVVIADNAGAEAILAALSSIQQ